MLIQIDALNTDSSVFAQVDKHFFMERIWGKPIKRVFAVMAIGLLVKGPLILNSWLLNTILRFQRFSQMFIFAILENTSINL